VLVVLSRDDDDAARSFRNLPDVQVILAGELNASDVLVNDWIVFTTATLPGEAPVAAGEKAAVVPTTEAAEESAE
ncbi:MAG: 50S ribosomal protein L4, partial [Acidimicrobiales bacterium]